MGGFPRVMTLRVARRRGWIQKDAFEVDRVCASTSLVEGALAVVAPEDWLHSCFRVGATAELKSLLADVGPVVFTAAGTGLLRRRAAVVFVRRLIVRLLVGVEDLFAVFWLGLLGYDEPFVREGFAVTL